MGRVSWISPSHFFSTKVIAILMACSLAVGNDWSVLLHPEQFLKLDNVSKFVYSSNETLTHKIVKEITDNLEAAKNKTESAFSGANDLTNLTIIVPHTITKPIPELGKELTESLISPLLDYLKLDIGILIAIIAFIEVLLCLFMVSLCGYVCLAEGR